MVCTQYIYLQISKKPLDAVDLKRYQLQLLFVDIILKWMARYNEIPTRSSFLLYKNFAIQQELTI